MEPLRIVMLVCLTVFLAEGFTRAMFPGQFKQFLLDAECAAAAVAGTGRDGGRFGFDGRVIAT